MTNRANRQLNTDHTGGNLTRRAGFSGYGGALIVGTMPKRRSEISRNGSPKHVQDSKLITKSPSTFGVRPRCVAARQVCLSVPV